MVARTDKGKAEIRCAIRAARIEFYGGARPNPPPGISSARWQGMILAILKRGAKCLVDYAQT